MKHLSILRLAGYAMLAWMSVVWAACASEVVEEDSVGSIALALNYDGARHDVAGAQYKIVAANDPEGCEGEAVAATSKGLESESLPEYLDPDGGGGDNHPFADALFVLPWSVRTAIRPEPRNCCISVAISYGIACTGTMYGSIRRCTAKARGVRRRNDTRLSWRLPIARRQLLGRPRRCLHR